MFRHRSALLAALSAPVVVAALHGGGLGSAAAAIGAGLVGAGALLRLVAMRQIGRGARVHRVGVRRGLCTSGPYRWSRNPLYLAAALILCGLGALAGAGWSAAWLVPVTLVVYWPVVRIEENAMAEELGEAYRRYTASTARWIGWPAPRSAEGFEPVSWREVLRREKRLLPGCLAAGLATAGIGSGVVPLGSLVREWTAAIGGSTPIVVALFAVAVAGNALHVELHQRRRRVRRLEADEESMRGLSSTIPPREVPGTAR